MTAASILEEHSGGSVKNLHSWACSSLGRAPHLQCGGSEFESHLVHCKVLWGCSAIGERVSMALRRLWPLWRQLEARMSRRVRCPNIG